MSETATKPYIPTDDEASVPTGGKTPWRVVDGCICKGKKEEGNLETRPKLTGAITKIGVREGHNKDKAGDFERKLVIQMETAEGVESLSIKFFSKGKYSAFSQFFGAAYILSQTKPGDVIVFTATKGMTAHKEHGTFPTYLNGFKMVVDASGNPVRKSNGEIQYTELRRPKEEKGTESPGERVESVLNDLRSHELWGEFASGADGEEGGEGKMHFNGLIKLCQSRGWLLPTEDNGAWLELMERAGFKPSSGWPAFDDIDDGVWGEVLSMATNSTTQPKTLEAAQAARKSLTSASSSLSDL